MTREEAIYILQNLKTMAIRDKYIMPNSGWVFDLGKIIDLLQEKPTLAEFLGWEEGVEYKANCELYKIENDTLKIRYGKRWVDDYELHLNNYGSLIGAKKIEKKTKEELLEELLDELQHLTSSEKINDIIKQLREIE